MDMGKFVDRRLHPVRIALGLMNHEMELARGESTVTMDREVMRSVIETVSLFVEDFEVSNKAIREQTQKKFAQANQAGGGGGAGGGGSKVG